MIGAFVCVLLERKEYDRAMNISRVQFVIRFIIFGFVFLFVTTSLLGSTGVRGFPKYPDSLLGLDSPVAWKRTASAIVSPIKVVLIGPLLLPGVGFLQDDPPPPLIGILFVFYWTLLASGMYYFFQKIQLDKQGKTSDAHGTMED